MNQKWFNRITTGNSSGYGPGLLQVLMGKPSIPPIATSGNSGSRRSLPQGALAKGAGLRLWDFCSQNGLKKNEYSPKEEALMQ